MGKELKTPLIFPEGLYSQHDIAKFRSQNPEIEILDIYEEQLTELFEILHPNLDPESSNEIYQRFLKTKIGSEKGSWVFYPWSGRLLHILNEANFFALRTNRNQHLITKDEQQKLQEFSVGVLGLSVGGSMAVALAYSAACGELRLSDKDTFSTSNMNRVRVRVGDVGQSKLDVTMRQIYEANPYAKLKGFDEGVSKENIADFIADGKFILLEEIDDFDMKIRVRLEAAKRRVPVVMLTNLGDNVLVDIERYDLQDKLKPFNGMVDNKIIEAILNGQLSEEEKKGYAVQIVGTAHVPTRALESVRDIGRSLVGRPQLYSSVAISGGLATYIVRQIALGAHMPTGRYFYSLADVFKQPRLDLQLNDKRRQILKMLKRRPPIRKRYIQPPQLEAGHFFSTKNRHNKIACLLEYAILAPSTHNTQPWRIKIEDDSCKIFIDNRRQLPVADKLRRDMYISLGAFLKNLEAAARAYGVYDRTDLAGQSDELVAEVYFKKLDKVSATEVDPEQLKAIQTRSNYRGPLAPFAVSDNLRSFVAGLSSGQLKILMVEDRKKIEKLAALTAQGLRLAYKNPAFRREISSWINPNTSRRKAGIPGYSLRMPTLTSHVIPRVIRFKDIGKKLAELNYRSFISSSAAVIFTAEKEEPETWLTIGQAAQEILLHIESHGAAASIYVAAVEMGNLSQSVKEVLGIRGKTKPQFLFCIGKPIWPKVYSPREPLKSKLIY
ncbi:MAG TPA: ThiF family adenylyltransferase [Candidatus Saccharimonadales bacterium]